MARSRASVIRLSSLLLLVVASSLAQLNSNTDQCSGSYDRKLSSSLPIGLDFTIGNSYCNPWSADDCGQSVHFIWNITGTRSNVGVWQPIESVQTALINNRLAKGDVIASFNGAFQPCGFGGHAAVFDSYDRSRNVVYILQQSAAFGVVTREILADVSQFYTVSLPFSSSSSSSSSSSISTGSILPQKSLLFLSGEQFCSSPDECQQLRLSLPLACVGDSECDDGNPCTVNDRCVNGMCQGELRNVCNSSNACQMSLVDELTCECRTVNMLNNQRCTVNCAGDGMCFEGQCIAAPRFNRTNSGISSRPKWFV